MKVFYLISLGCYLSSVVLAQEGDLIFDIELSKEEVDEENKWIDNPEVQLPESVIICKRHDPNRDECIKSSLEHIIPTFKDGYPSLAIAPFDPLSVKSAYFEYKQNQLTAKLNVKSAKIYGMSAAQIKDVRSNITENDMALEIDVRFPKILMEGNYKGQGQLRDYRVKSKGFFNVTYSNVFVMWRMNAKLEVRDGENYMVVQSVDVAPIVGNLKIYATGIFPDGVLNQIALDFINEYWPYYYQQVLPETRKTWEPILVNAVNQIFNRVPFRRLMPAN